MTADHARKRSQFGHPIATFQAVTGQAADRFLGLRARKATLWQACARGRPRCGRPRGESTREPPDPLPATGDVVVAETWTGEGVRRVVRTARYPHGGFGADVRPA